MWVNMTALLVLNMIYTYIYGAYEVHMPVFLVQLPRRHRKQPLLQEACRLGSAWQCALQLLQVTLADCSELQADVVSQLDFLSDL